MAWKRKSTSKRAWGQRAKGAASSRQPTTIHSKGWHQTGGLKHNKEA